MNLLTTLLLTDAVEKYSPDQARDDKGRWGEASSTANASTKATHGKGNTATNHQVAARAHNKAARTHMLAAVKAGGYLSKEGRQHIAQADKHFFQEIKHTNAAFRKEPAENKTVIGRKR